MHWPRFFWTTRYVVVAGFVGKGRRRYLSDQCKIPTYRCVATCARLHAELLTSGPAGRHMTALYGRSGLRKLKSPLVTSVCA